MPVKRRVNNEANDTEFCVVIIRPKELQNKCISKWQSTCKVEYQKKATETSFKPTWTADDNIHTFQAETPFLAPFAAHSLILSLMHPLDTPFEEEKKDESTKKVENKPCGTVQKSVKSVKS